MLRASSGKHARLVGVCRAGGDSVPVDALDAAACSNLSSLYKEIDV